MPSDSFAATLRVQSIEDIDRAGIARQCETEVRNVDHEAPFDLYTPRTCLSRGLAGIGTRLPCSTQLRADDPVKVLALGDSLTAGYGLKQGEGFADQLQTAFGKMGRPVTVINGGVSGDTSAGGLARIDWALADQPKVVHPGAWRQ